MVQRVRHCFFSSRRNLSYDAILIITLILRRSIFNSLILSLFSSLLGRWEFYLFVFRGKLQSELWRWFSDIFLIDGIVFYTFILLIYRNIIFLFFFDHELVEFNSILEIKDTFFELVIVVNGWPERHVFLIIVRLVFNQI